MNTKRKMQFCTMLLCVIFGASLALPLSVSAANFKLSYPDIGKSFYADREFEAFWLDPRTGSYTDHARALVGLLKESWTHGLNPQRYHVGALPLLQGEALERALMDAYIAYAHDMSGMRIDAGLMGLDAEHWRQPLSTDVIVAQIQGDNGDGRRALAFVRGLTPKSKTYEALRRDLLSTVFKEEPPYADILPLTLNGGLLRPNDGHSAVPLFRKRLGLPQPPAGRRLVYDDALAAAVMRFQRENGLRADGIIGNATLKVMNRTKADRIAQIVANLERLRWVKKDQPSRFIVVNIPSAKLWAVEGGQVAHEMRVIVGRPGRPTVPFMTRVRGVRLNPTWTIPPTIKAQDMLPNLQEDPYYLAKVGVELLDGYGREAQTLDPTSVDWAMLDGRSVQAYNMVQPAGDTNPLGRVRLLMPNRHNIYLHDTNHPEKFQAPTRALSSGCVRMEYPDRIAEFVMRPHKSWGQGALQSYIDRGESVDLRVEHSVPVYLLYYTTWLDSKGGIVYGNDLYGRDRRLVELLRDINGFSYPLKGGEMVAYK